MSCYVVTMNAKRNLCVTEVELLNKLTVDDGVNPFRNVSYKSLDDAVRRLFKSSTSDNTDFRVRAGIYSAAFDASPFYHSILEGFFRRIAPFCVDGSFMEIYPDSGYQRLEVKSGSVEEIYEEETINPFFDNGNDFYDWVCSSEHGAYNETTNDFVAMYSDSGDIITYKVSREMARKLARSARENAGTWLSELGPGGQIISESDAVEYLNSILSPETSEDWIYAGPYADYYALFFNDTHMSGGNSDSIKEDNNFYRRNA